jgi:hypothetical protein
MEAATKALIHVIEFRRHGGMSSLLDGMLRCPRRRVGSLRMLEEGIWEGIGVCASSLILHKGKVGRGSVPRI